MINQCGQHHCACAVPVDDHPAKGLGIRWYCHSADMRHCGCLQDKSFIGMALRQEAVGAIPLKVVLGPQRGRTHISFEEKLPMSSGSQKPTLTIFAHHEGSQVYSSLFPKYVLPNGKEAYYYYCAGMLLPVSQCLTARCCAWCRHAHHGVILQDFTQQRLRYQSDDWVSGHLDTISVGTSRGCSTQQYQPGYHICWHVKRV